MLNHRFTRIVPVLAASSLLAACQGGGAGPAAPQSVPRAAQSSSHGDARAVDTTRPPASPASLEFTGDQAAAGAPQTVTISAKDEGKLRVSIAGTGNCPAVSPSSLKPHRSEHDNRDHDGHDTATAVITVTPAGPGPAVCAITVRHRDGDDNDDAAIVVPVIVDAAATPTPSPTPFMR